MSYFTVFYLLPPKIPGDESDERCWLGARWRLAVAAGREVAITTAPRISSNKQTQRILNKRTQGTILLSTDNLIRRSEMNLFGKRQPVEPAAVGVDAVTNVQPMKWNHEPEMSASFLNGLFLVWIQPMFSCAAFLKKRVSS